MMTRVKFYDPSFSPDRDLVYSVIAARFQGQWIFVRHHERSTWEIAGGHIEEGESPDDTARRELAEETGASLFDLTCVATYSVEKDGTIGLGKLYLAEVQKLTAVPDASEIAETLLADDLPANLTYPDIQPHMFRKIKEYLNERF
jgi:8-oxo-dGTP diphosphatase